MLSQSYATVMTAVILSRAFFARFESKAKRSKGEAQDSASH